MERPYIPFYKPYGMTDEEYEYEVAKAEQAALESDAEQEQLNTYKMKTALDLIAEERERQQTKEGWTKEHDLKEHDGGALALAAACYAAHPLKIYRMEEYAKSIHYDQIIPFDEYQIDNKHNDIKRLVIAGALIVGEIERLQAGGV